MLMFTCVQLCATRKQALLQRDSTDVSRHVSFPNNTDWKNKNQKHDMGLTPQCSLRGTTKIPLIGAWGFPLSTPVCGPWEPNIHNNVNIENISLKTMWNGLIDTSGRGSRMACAQAQPRRPQAPGVWPCEGGRQLQNKRHQPRSLSLSLFHMKVCKKQISK